ncbi:MAG: CvpA family protein [Anaerolineaceae bacterium]|nr:CvpA family protein [Anaerolineaceae bacterium]
MLQLSALLWGMAGLFAVVGWLRGLNKELIAMAGIVLGLFALFQFDGFLRNQLLVSFTADQKFFIQTILFGVVVFFAYQTRALIGEEAARARENRQSKEGGRDALQSGILGALAGFINGYLIWGSIWYFMHINNYPLAPFVTAPVQGSPSADTVSILPLYFLAGGPAGSGDLLALAVILLFLFVLIVI